MNQMSPEDAATHILGAINVLREDIARAKDWILQGGRGSTSELSREWAADGNFHSAWKVELSGTDCIGELDSISREISRRLAFLQAVAELVSAAQIIPAGGPTKWSPSVAYESNRSSGGIPLRDFGCSYPERIELLPSKVEVEADTDVFLKGVDCASLHGGIQEAIQQSLACFNRGLYMPATAMLAAAAEATWIECGGAVATELGDSKLSVLVEDPNVGIGTIVGAVRKALEHGNAKPLLRKAGRTTTALSDAELWTTALRDRRNALHWGKAKSFIADHSSTASLMLGAPIHVKTLEAIRMAC